MDNCRIINSYTQTTPKLRFIGKAYQDSDRENGSFGAKWGEWFANGWFAQLEPLMTEGLKAAYPDTDAYIGLMRGGGSGPFTYWIGMFLPENAAVPESFKAVDLPFTEMAVAWIQGREEMVYGHEGEVMELFAQKGVHPATEANGDMWFFERYACPRFTTPGEYGEIILDIGFFTR